MVSFGAPGTPYRTWRKSFRHPARSRAALAPPARYASEAWREASPRREAPLRAILPLSCPRGPAPVGSP